MTTSFFARLSLVLFASASLSLTAHATTNVGKTMRVEHGRPIVVVSQDAVLWLEFLPESRAAAAGSNSDPDRRYCRAQYRYQIFDAASGAVTKGQGTVEEVFQVVSRSATGQQLEDRGSRTSIDAGGFHLGWSEGTAGSRSWIYYRTDSPIRFIQQPQQLTFDAVDAKAFRRYLAARNVQEFSAAQQSVQVIGPAVFSGDLPDETPVPARIEYGRLHDGTFELKLVNLTTNTPYLIESSYALTRGGWNPVHKFVATSAELVWSDPVGKDVNMAFYRIRQGH
jgi:hypothetical protein